MKLKGFYRRFGGLCLLAAALGSPAARHMDYERVPRSDDPDDERRFRQRTLQRWRLSMLVSFGAGVLVTFALYPRLHPCPKFTCPTCPACPAVKLPDTQARAPSDLAAWHRQCLLRCVWLQW